MRLLKYYIKAIDHKFLWLIGCETTRDGGKTRKQFVNHEPQFTNSSSVLPKFAINIKLLSVCRLMYHKILFFLDSKGVFETQINIRAFL